MSIEKLHFIDLTIILLYLVICLSIGLVKARQVTCLREFAFVDGNIPTTVLVCMIFASSIGAGALFGGAEKVYLFGMVFVIRQLLRPLHWFISMKIVLPRIERFKDCLSISQIMYKLYGHWGLWITNIATILTSLGKVGAQAFAIGQISNYFLGIDPMYGILVSYGVITIYSTFGGIRAIIPTEVFKCVIFFFIIPISYIIALVKVGGMHEFIEHLPLSHLKLEINKDNILLITGLVLYALLPGIDCNFIQRCLMANNSKKLAEALKTVIFISMPFSISICIIAYVIRAYAPYINSNEVFLYYIDNYVPIGLKGLMIAGVLAVGMSLAEAWLNSTSIIIVNDCIKQILPHISNVTQLKALRITVLILSVLSILLTISSNSVIDLMLLALNFWEPLIIIPICAGFLGFKTTGISFITSVVMALIAIMTGRIITGEFAMISLSLGIVGSAIGLFGMHYLQKLLNFLPSSLIMDIHPKVHVYGKIGDIKNSVIKFAISIVTLIKHGIEPQHMHISKFCTFTLAYYVIYTLGLTPYYGHQIFSYLLMFGYFLCMVLLFRDWVFTPGFQRRYLHLVWYFTLTFCLPLVASYMILISKDNDFWVINSIICCLALIFFVDARRFLLLNSIGIALGFILFKLTMDNLEVLHFHATIGYTGYIYVFLIISAFFFFIPKEKLQEERVETMQIFGGAVAHEVRSPLASMIMNAEHLSFMLDGMDKVKKSLGDRYRIEITKEDFEEIRNVGKSLHSISVKGIYTIDRLLTALKTNVHDDDKAIYFMQETVKQALQEYNISIEPASDIKINIINDFQFYGSYHFMKHTILNLIKNAHKHGGKNVKIEITIDNNRLYIKDNGYGIPQEILPRIFEKFFTSNKAGTGIGLAFCKLVMESLGGIIECESIVGQHTTFILTFPTVNNSKPHN